MTRPRIVLFDIDGTLISTGGAGHRAMLGAFGDKYGKPGEPLEARQELSFSFAGMTDRAIVRRGLAVHGHHEDEAAIDALLAGYLTRLDDELSRSERYKIYPGVIALLERLSTISCVAVGLGTGNVRSGAYRKLARGGIDGSFAFGGFGCDAELRAELLAVGVTRGAAALDAPASECEVIVIGDTAHDVSAALAIGAMCIGVGTGGVALEELRRLGAHHAVATLDDPLVDRVLFESS